MRSSRFLLVFALLGLALRVSSQVKQPYFPIISYITPPRGGLAGGTQIEIFGSGFARNGVDGQ
jgi:hypothetical protein